MPNQYRRFAYQRIGYFNCDGNFYLKLKKKKTAV